MAQREIKLEKRWVNSSGTILVRESPPMHCGVVEMLHLYDKNTSGCAIAYWEKKKGEFRGIDDRLTNTEYDNASILLEALRFGQKLADLLVDIQPQTEE